MDPMLWHKVAAVSGNQPCSSSSSSPPPLPGILFPQSDHRDERLTWTGVAALGLGTYGAHMFRPKNPAYKEVDDVLHHSHSSTVSNLLLPIIDLLFIIRVNDFGRFGTRRPSTISSTPPHCSGRPSPSTPTLWVPVPSVSIFLLLRCLPVNLHGLSDCCVCSSEVSSLLE